jgi:hypothetical protein
MKRSPMNYLDQHRRRSSARPYPESVRSYRINFQEDTHEKGRAKTVSTFYL